MQISTGRRGSFEVTRDGKTLFSRLETSRFPDPDEIIDELTESA